MKEDYVVFILKSFVINIYTYMAFYKIINEKHKNWITIILSSIGISGIYTITRIYSDNILPIIIMYLLQTIILKCSIKNKKYTVMIANLIANAIVYMALVIAVIVNIGVIAIFKELNVIINLITTLIIEFLILYLFFKIRRFKNGFPFLQNKANGEYLDIIMMNISAVIMFAYCLFGNGTGNGAIVKQILFPFIVLVVIMIIMIQKTLTVYYKQKQLEKNIQEYEKEIKDKDNKIEELSKEKFEISKLNHEFYNRQKAMQLKVDNLLSNMNTEMANEISVIDQINNLSKEYSNKLEEIKHIEKLPTTEIEEIDDMFKYMQSECKSKNIQFNLQINGNIYHMINNKIAQNKLVTMIGDHLRDAIIAIEFSENSFKSILAILGENNGLYEFCVFDTGIEFKIDTLLKLGLEPATTHKDSGGTGIGFMTTFETMSETKASLIINEMHEMNNTDYTKSITIRFDGKNEYRIKSYRSDEIKKKLKDNRIIIEN